MKTPRDQAFKGVPQDVLKGVYEKIVVDVRELLDKVFCPDDILNQGILPSMEVIGGRFKKGEVFIPKVLLSAWEMNEAEGPGTFSGKGF